jgi:Predicted secreted Zn-dependent protease
MAAGRRRSSPRGSLTLAVLLCLLSACTTGKPGMTYRAYAVAGDSGEAILRSVRASAPRDGRAYGLTQITFHPVYALADAKARCAVERATVGVELVLLLPQWREGAPPAPRVRGVWNRFEGTVRAHEHTHATIAKAHARRLERTLLALRAPDCGGLRRRIDEEIARAKRTHLAAQAAFDLREKKKLKSLLP